MRLNEYAPFGEWHRLVNNEGVGAGWRYSLGFLSWLFYTLLPGRIFGGDAYNPYTNTIYLYSDVPAVALHEGGHAKDIAVRNWKGSRAALYIVPFAPLFMEAVATNDALGYSLDTDPKLLESGYKMLYPAYGTYVGSEGLGAVPGRYRDISSAGLRRAGCGSGILTRSRPKRTTKKTRRARIRTSLSPVTRRRPRPPMAKGAPAHRSAPSGHDPYRGWAALWELSGFLLSTMPSTSILYPLST